jgi:hypothetical protein
MVNACYAAMPSKGPISNTEGLLASILSNDNVHTVLVGSHIQWSTIYTAEQLCTDLLEGKSVGDALALFSRDHAHVGKEYILFGDPNDTLNVTLTKHEASFANLGKPLRRRTPDVSTECFEEVLIKRIRGKAQTPAPEGSDGLLKALANSGTTPCRLWMEKYLGVTQRSSEDCPTCGASSRIYEVSLPYADMRMRELVACPHCTAVDDRVPGAHRIRLKRLSGDRLQVSGLAHSGDVAVSVASLSQNDKGSFMVSSSDTEDLVIDLPPASEPGLYAVAVTTVGGSSVYRSVRCLIDRSIVSKRN